MTQTSTNVAMQFDDAEQQRSAAVFGMWVFLTTEVLFFGGMFVAYVVYRSQFPAAFTEAGAHVNLWAGGAMTAILLLGSLLVATSDHLLEHVEEISSHDSDLLRRAIVWRLIVTALLGGAFLACEVYEYYTLVTEGLFPGAHFDNAQFAVLEFSGGASQLYFVLFFCMTGLHGLHMVIGISLLIWLAIAIGRSREPVRLKNTMKVVGLYWHFVDIVWLFLYPLFYLVQ